MATTIRLLLLSGAVFFHLLQAKGQVNPDFQYRFISAIDYKLTKKWKIAAEYRYSAENDLQKFRNSYVQFEGKYSKTKKLSVSGGYRFTTSHELDAHRFFVAVEYNHKLSKLFSVAGASKYQYSTNSFNPEFMNEFEEPVRMLREKLSVEFNVPKSKLAFHTGAEVFIQTGSQPMFSYNRTRYQLGTSYSFGDYGKFGLSVFFDDRYNPEKTDRFVLVTKYSLSLDKLLNHNKEEKKETSK
ncbi:MAG TPA: DUF2490 domain-containing protein [Catalimonadaceae bacterium]|nr:DUF2490 domain-containing protein [Catalimonadaceae bacterium]HPI12880.1 DUF2490 domain-containing protein [Catalimonadaceae bacterium]